MSSTTLKKISAAKAKKIARWKVRIISKFRTIKEFIDKTDLNYKVFSNWLHAWKIPSDDAIECVENWMREFGC